jgi:isopentenyl phosphate kinase
MARKLYFIKIGGSIITDVEKPMVAKPFAIRRIFKEIEEARKEKEFDLIIGHGQGSFAHIPAAKYKVNDGLKYEDSKKGAAITHMAAKEMNDIVIREALDAGSDVFPFSPSSFGVWGGSEPSGFFEHIRGALDAGLIPVTYGDVVIDRDKGVCIAGTEKVFKLLAKGLRPHKIILATDVDGVFDKNPKDHADARLISDINGGNIERILGFAGASKKVDVTGGMHTKLLILHEMVKETQGEGIITNGLKEGNIRKALLGDNYDGMTVVKP